MDKYVDFKDKFKALVSLAFFSTLFLSSFIVLLIVSLNDLQWSFLPLNGFVSFDAFSIFRKLKTEIKSILSSNEEINITKKMRITY